MNDGVALSDLVDGGLLDSSSMTRRSFGNGRHVVELGSVAGLLGTALALVAVQGSGSFPGLLTLALLLGDHVLDVLLLCESTLTLLLEQLVGSGFLAW